MRPNGPEYTVVPLESDKIMHIGYIKRRDSRLSSLGQKYIRALQKSKPL